MGTIKDIVDLSTQLANSVSDRKIAADINQIQSLTLQLQSEQADLHEKNMQLREDLLKLQTVNNDLTAVISKNDDWQSKLSEYELVTTSGGATVYKFKDNAVHYICPSCISKKVIKPLQNCMGINGMYSCPGCGVKYPVNPPMDIDPITYDSPFP
ncbi:MAG: hypothetical protein KAR45_18205 [Desulfobacteraceae bacterium]|nr:hypothetical protein [Desulfobacteraceae bacterium]